jgi:hypothetical protein
VQVARFMHVAMPQFERVAARPLRGVNGLAALRSEGEEPRGAVVGATRRPSKGRSLNVRE